MSTKKPARYDHRSVFDWLDMADRGVVALPTFQRSYVWNPDRIADYLCALLENRPTGIFLTLEILDELPFESRTLNLVDADPNNAQELLLDGQQRLTSLWSVLIGKSEATFYVEVEDLSNRDLTVRSVEYYTKSSAQGKRLLDPSVAYAENFVPIDVLYDEPRKEGRVPQQDPDEPGKIWKWCKSACDDEENARRLENAIRRCLREPLLLTHELHYCSLPTDTQPSVAINIFVETNKSSATIKTFDIVVALAQQAHKENLRQRIKRLWAKYPVIQHYFRGDEQKWIPDIGEWILKVACLKYERADSSTDGVPPKEIHYYDALNYILKRGSDTTSQTKIDELLNDLVLALETVAGCGCATKEILPGWPSMHVVAALQEDIRSISKAAWRGTVHRVISAYLWRSFLTDRYEKQANDRLHRDFMRLRQCLRMIGKCGKYDHGSLPPIFDDVQHPVPRRAELADLDAPIPWIGTGGRIGRSVVAITIQSAVDWVTGEKLDVAKVRQFKSDGNLDNHHIFPRAYLKGTLNNRQINCGLNGVILCKPANKALASKAPDVYLRGILQHSQGLTESELRHRVESHLVPYDALVSSKPVEDRYRQFIAKRARLIEKAIRRLVKL